MTLRTPARSIVLAAMVFAALALAAPASAGIGQRVSGARIAAVAERVARTLMTDAEASLATAYTVGDVGLGAGAVTLTAAGNPTVTPTYIGVPVTIGLDGSVARTVVVGFRVTHFVRTAVATHDLGAGAVIGPADVAVGRIASIGRPAVDPAGLVGRKVLGMLPKGTPVFPEATIADQLVRPGQPAILMVRDGGIALSADVIARTGGALGDIVTVVNPNTGKALAAVVVGRGQCELRLPEVPQ